MVSFFLVPITMPWSTYQLGQRVLAYRKTVQSVVSILVLFWQYRHAWCNEALVYIGRRWDIVRNHLEKLIVKRYSVVYCKLYKPPLYTDIVRRGNFIYLWIKHMYVSEPLKYTLIKTRIETYFHNELWANLLYIWSEYREHILLILPDIGVKSNVY